MIDDEIRALDDFHRHGPWHICTCGRRWRQPTEEIVQCPLMAGVPPTRIH